MKRFFLYTFGSIFVFCLALLIFIKINTSPISQSSSPKTFVVNQGDGLVSISRRLKSNQFVRSQLVFIFHAYRLGLNRQLQAGTFLLSSSLSTEEIVQKLSRGGSHDYWLKIIDGTRLEEIKNQVPADFSSLAIDLEGQLFPDSYLIPEDYTSQEILAVIQKNFSAKFAQAKVSATNTELSDSQIVTLASLLEREGRTLPSKQMIAGILLNRLKINMALQVDATVQYARDTIRTPKVYWQPLSSVDLKIKSPFNTYLQPGLPPSPICNPGYDSLYAAFHPTSSDYLYYITGTDGQMYYAATLDAHNQNVSKYLISD
jgi:UPF0755 protein